jgi:hypothetical protein
MKCLQKKPHQRYASASALGADLERALAGEAVEAPPPPSSVRLIAASVAVALAVAAGAVAVVVSAPEAPPSIAPVAVIASVVASEPAPEKKDPLASPTFGLPAAGRVYRCQWYAQNGSPGLMSFRATLALGPAVVGPDGAVRCDGTLSELNVWGGPPGDEDSFNKDHDFPADLRLPLQIRISSLGDVLVAGLSKEVRMGLWNRLPEEKRDNPQGGGLVWPGYVARDYLDDGLLADMLQLSLPCLAKMKRDVEPKGVATLTFERVTGPPLVFTRIHEGVVDESEIKAQWVLDDDHCLVSCSLTDRAATRGQSVTAFGETWWGMGPPDQFRKLERRRR